MPRRNQPARRGTARPAGNIDGPGGRGLGEQVHWWRGLEFRVRSVSGSTPSGPAGSYRCPGCDQLLAAGIAHVVAWAADDLDASDRRHWHAGCWTARDRRAPGVQRSRNAPRYG